jgi:hypothetical protein
MKFTNALQIRASDEFVRQVDDWRRHQIDVPTRAEAVRRLVEKAIEADKTADRKHETRT